MAPRIALLAAAMASRIAPISALDLSIGGELSSSYNAPVSLPGEVPGGGAYTEGASFAFEPILAASGELGGGRDGESPPDGPLSWELAARGRLAGRTRGSLASAGLDSAEGRLSWGPLSLELGYGRDDSFAAEVFPQSVFLGPSDPLERVDSGPAGPRRASEPYARLGAAAGAFRASILAAPFAPPLVLPDLGSPWIPRTTLPGTVTVAGVTYSLDTSYAEQDSAAWEPDPSWLAELGAVLGPVDLDLRLFSGRERQAALHGILSTLQSPSAPWHFPLELVADRARVEALALSAAGAAGPLRLWFEGGWTRGASLATGSYEIEGSGGAYYRIDAGVPSSTDVPPIVSRDRLAATAGASWTPELGGLSLTAFTEGCWTSFIDPPAGADAPALSRALALGLTLGDARDRCELSLSGMVSLRDGSSLFRPSLSAAFGAEGRIGLELSLFDGEGDTELGQYAALRFLSFSVTQRL